MKEIENSNNEKQININATCQYNGERSPVHYLVFLVYHCKILDIEN